MSDSMLYRVMRGADSTVKYPTKISNVSFTRDFVIDSFQYARPFSHLLGPRVNE